MILAPRQFSSSLEPSRPAYSSADVKRSIPAVARLLQIQVNMIPPKVTCLFYPRSAPPEENNGSSQQRRAISPLVHRQGTVARRIHMQGVQPQPKSAVDGQQY